MKMKKPGSFRRKMIVAACVFAVLLAVIGGLIGAFFAMRTAGRNSFESRRENDTPARPPFPEQAETQDVTDADYDPNAVYYHGKVFHYNENLTTLLFIGTDQERLGHIEGLTGSGGQSDVLLVLALDEAAHTAQLISIDRNSIVSMETFDADGESIGYAEHQIAYAFAFGDGRKSSAELTLRAASEFLYGMPIHAYFVMPTSVIGTINDAVGGVTVTIPTDMTSVDKSFVKGRTVTLRGRQAEAFLRARIGVGDGLNTERLSRQKQYLNAFVGTAKRALLKDLTLPLKVYRNVKKNCCTDLTESEITYLASLISDLDISYRAIKGTTVEGEYPEFYPDTEALWDMILNIFYTCEEGTDA